MNISGNNPIESVFQSKDFIKKEVSLTAVWGLLDVGAINVNTGCYLAPLVKKEKMLGKNYQYTGEIVAIWNTSSAAEHGYRLTPIEAKEFIEKVCN
ncbi:hypothetical protein WE348_21195 (plasmid) [Alteromonas macleodii]|uniref:hypothetical protein n=1 Tax=Alteromonas macleodii TaxID=28108 RepID=UPI0030CF8857